MADIDWSDPAARGRLLSDIGPAAYNARHTANVQATTVVTVNGHAIRPVSTRFGRLYAVGGTPNAFSRIGEAIRFAAAEAFASASHRADLDEACALLQTACEIDSGDGAGVFFTGREEEWASAAPEARERMLMDWLALEFPR